MKRTNKPKPRPVRARLIVGDYTIDIIPVDAVVVDGKPQVASCFVPDDPTEKAWLQITPTVSDGSLGNVIAWVINEGTVRTLSRRARKAVPA